MLGFSSRANWRNCCTARCWSIWYRLFIATLSFSWQKKPPSAHYDRGCESRYFLRINGHPPSKLLRANGVKLGEFWPKSDELIRQGYDQPTAYLTLLLDNVGDGKPLGNLTNDDLGKFGAGLDGDFF